MSVEGIVHAIACVENQDNVSALILRIRSVKASVVVPRTAGDLVATALVLRVGAAPRLAKAGGKIPHAGAVGGTGPQALFQTAVRRTATGRHDI